MHSTVTCVRCAAKMADAYATTSFDQLSVGQPPATTASTRKPETEVTSPDVRGGKTRSRRQRRQATGARSAESTSFVGLMQQLSVDGRELFELAERGHFDMVESTATKDVSGGPITFTSPEAYLSLTSVTQSSAFSIYFRVLTDTASMEHSLCLLSRSRRIKERFRSNLRKFAFSNRVVDS